MLAKGQISFAEARLATLLKSSPKNLELNYLMSQCCKYSGRLSKQILYLEKALKADSKNEGILGKLGEAYLNVFLPEKAVKCFIKLTRINPSVQGLIFLSKSYQKNGQFSHAKNTLEKTIQNFPENKQPYFALAELCLHEGFDKEAVQLMEKAAFEKFEEDAETLKNLAHAYKDTGETKKARDLYKKALKLDASYGEAYRQWARISGIELDNELDNLALAALKKNSVKMQQRSEFGFGLFERFFKRKLYDEAWGFLVDANKTKFSQLNYNIEDELKFQQALFSFFKQNPIADKISGYVNAEPIFVVGFPRSGTTLVEQILGSHSKVAGAGEREEYQSILLQILDKKYGSTQVKNIEKFENKDFEILGKKYWKSLSYIRKNSKHIVDKMPANYTILPLIAATFPNGKFVLCVRDAMETVFSNYRSNFTNGNDYSFDLDCLVKVYRQYLEMIKLYKQLLGDRLYVLEYEKLVLDQKQITETLLDYCGLDFEENCMKFYQNSGSVTSASASQVRQPIYTSAIKASLPYQNILSKYDFS